jgi:hypothetical protein
MKPSESYTPEFTKWKRDGKTSLWVKMPNGGTYNIWDVAKTSPETEAAIISAFERGFVAFRMIVDLSADISTAPRCGFEEQADVRR